ASLGVKENVSWHSEYKDSAWIFIGGFPYELTEGDIVCVFSQYGEMANINLVRDKKTGKSKGFCFICYEDQRSTILAVDNLNGIKIKGRTIRVDHVLNYRPPKDNEDMDDITKRLREEGCAPKLPDPSSSESEEEQYAVPAKKPKKGETRLMEVQVCYLSASLDWGFEMQELSSNLWISHDWEYRYASIGHRYLFKKGRGGSENQSVSGDG
uniref:RNA binding motif protein X-linked 2 n=1 Tax=Oncorhynchus mykiss TaxID=8022 RepID=A0A8K9WX26_ONCMY